MGDRSPGGAFVGVAEGGRVDGVQTVGTSRGVELEERYCEISAKRLSQQVFDFSDLEECK